jgi:hypothetical protein
MEDWLTKHLTNGNDEAPAKVEAEIPAAPAAAEPVSVVGSSRCNGPHLERKLKAERLERERLERKALRRKPKAKKPADERDHVKRKLNAADHSAKAAAQVARFRRRDRAKGMDEENRRTAALTANLAAMLEAKDSK